MARGLNACIRQWSDADLEYEENERNVPKQKRTNSTTTGLHILTAMNVTIVNLLVEAG